MGHDLRRLCMHAFTDALGRSWTIEITVTSLKRIRALSGIDLLEAISGTLLDRLVTDPVLLGDVLYAAIKPQADERKITDEDFGRSLAGDTIDTATSALLEEFVSFFPMPRRRVLEKVLAKLAAWRAQAITVAEARIDDPMLEQTVQAALAKPGTLSGNAPALSESTRAG
jgi:hypothetical protein